MCADFLSVLVVLDSKGAVSRPPPSPPLFGKKWSQKKVNKNLVEKAKQDHWEVLLPPFQYTTDNAAMIGIVGMYKYREKKFASLSSKPEARLSF